MMSVGTNVVFGTILFSGLTSNGVSFTPSCDVPNSKDSDATSPKKR